MITKVIFVNGPPRSGKDTAASLIVNEYPGTIRIGFADHLKKATHAAYGMFDVPFSYFENCKDEPNDLFFGLTPRQAYIKHSEEYMKLLHGPKVFGHLWMRAANGAKTANMVVVPDSGFAPEAEPGINTYGAANCLLLRSSRIGKDFSGDSRGYITLPGVETHDIANDSSLGDLRRSIIEIVDDWLYGKKILYAA